MSTTSISVGDIILSVTLLVVAAQAYYARRTLNLFVLQSKYHMFFELDKMLVADPRLQLLITRDNAAEKLKRAGPDGLKRKSFIELSLDIAEFNFMASQGVDRQHMTDYVRNVMSNPYVRAYWESDTRGWFAPDFVRFVNHLLHR